MEVKRFDSNGRFSRALIHGDTLYLSGMCAALGEDTKTQTAAVLDRIEETLEKYGSDRRHILSAVVYLDDIRKFDDMNSVWDSWVVPGYEPTRTTVEAKLANPQYSVEITVVAVLKE